MDPDRIASASWCVLIQWLETCKACHWTSCHIANDYRARFRKGLHRGGNRRRLTDCARALIWGCAYPRDDDPAGVERYAQMLSRPEGVYLARYSAQGDRSA